ncbi:MAG: BatD family protein [Pseudomonadota bacterium]
MEKTGKQMNKHKIGLAIIFFLMLLPITAVCFEMTAQVDKTQITLQDSILLEIIVHEGKADPDLSVIQDFKVSSRGTSSSYQYINGKSESKTIYRYLLTPISKGELTIPPIMAHKDGQTATTKPILIQVSDQVVNPDEVQALFAVASVLDPTLFVGQQAVYTIKFFTSRRLAGLGFENRPDFKGLTAKAFESEKNYTLNIKGQTFQVTQVDFLIIPSASGSVTIDPASFIAKVQVSSNQEAPFDSFFRDPFFSSSQYKPVRVASNPVTIDVKPLPDYKGGKVFSGLVGHFNVKADIDKHSLTVGESATLTIEVSGTGNIMDAGLPQIKLDDLGFKVYDDNPIDAIGMTANGYEGSKTFKKALVPVMPGKFKIDPVELVYFDVEKKVYHTAISPAIFLDVTASQAPVAAIPSAIPSAENRSVKKEVSLLNNDIMDVKEGLLVLKDYPPLGQKAFVFFLLLPGLLFSGIRLLLLFRSKDRSSAKIMQEKAKQYLKQAARTGAGDEAFLAHLYSALVATILARGNKIGETVTMAETRTILSNHGVEDKKVDEVVDVMQIIESVRFGGKKIDEYSAGQLFSRIRQIVKILACLLVCVTSFFWAPQKAVADVTSKFTQAMNQYRANQFEEAAKSFELIAKTPVRNPYLYYNIGNAYLKANDTGRAILWYERAKSLAPNDPDVLYNLNYANTLVKDKPEQSVDYLEILFFWDKFLGVKTAELAAISFSALFFLWAAVRAFKQNKIFSGTGTFLFALLVLSLVLSGVNYYKQVFRQTAVIVAQETAVRSGTAPTATQLFTLHAGTLVQVKEKRDNALKVAFSKQMAGWVKAGDVMIVQAIGNEK